MAPNLRRLLESVLKLPLSTSPLPNRHDIDVKTHRATSGPVHVAVRVPAASVADLVEKYPGIGRRQLLGSNEDREQARRRDEPGLRERGMNQAELVEFVT